MDLTDRIGADDARILFVAKGGRERQYNALKRGEEAPCEFFYGFVDLENAGASIAMMSSAAAMPGVQGWAADRFERGFASLVALGVRPLSTRLALPILDGAEVVVSFTDGFSLSLGLGLGGRRRRPILIGGFHGLSDIEHRPEVKFPALVRRLIKRALAGLDHVFFFGDVDRRAAVEQYGVAPERTSVLPFGVDTDFWRPDPEVAVEDMAVAIGQDLNRDFELLARAPGRNPTRIVTRRKIPVPPEAAHVQISSGDFFGSDSLSNEDLRRLYNMSRVVVVPLKDVNQPTGYSVTLQAMSCGRPVVLSRIRGLWAPELLVDGENCLLVPPNDAQALGEAIRRLREDDDLSARLSQAARETALRHFGLDKIADGAAALAQRGLGMAERRAAERGSRRPHAG